AIARSITNPSQQARAWTSLAEAVAATGDLDRARLLTDQTETIARSITDPYEAGTRSIIVFPPPRMGAFISLAEVVAKIGDRGRARLLTDQAETVARSITDPSQQAEALASLTEAVADTGDLDRAEAIARSITDPSQQARALTSLAEAVADTGDLDRARLLTDQTETIARSITDPSQQAEALASLTEAVADTG
ncbi:hypothetical protein, partial [Actinomadura citrea]